MFKWINVLLIGFWGVNGIIAAEKDVTFPLSVQPVTITNSLSLLTVLNRSELSGEKPEKASRMRRSSCQPNLLESELNAKRQFSFDTEMLMKRRATFLYDSYFSKPEGPQCFESKLESKGGVEKYILTYRHEIALNFYGFKRFDSKEEFVLFLGLLAEMARSSCHIELINVLLEKLK